MFLYKYVGNTARQLIQFAKKIIATTNPELEINTSKEYLGQNLNSIKKLPQPSEEFIKSYCNQKWY